MKIVYIATATTENGHQIQENAYEDAEQALEQAVKMCKDVERNTDMKKLMPDAVPFELFEKGETVPGPGTLSSDE